MYCKNCGEQLFEGQTICIKCGNPINEQKKQAPSSADYNIPAQYNGVKKCNDLNGHSKFSIMLLCMFFGFCGAHNFIMGENIKGIVKIITTVFFGLGIILSIIDLVKIIKNNYTYNPNAFI